MAHQLVDHLLKALGKVSEKKINKTSRSKFSQELLKCSTDADLRKTIRSAEKKYMEYICKHLNDVGKKEMDRLFECENQEEAKSSSDSKGSNPDASSQNQHVPIIVEHKYPSSEWRELLKKMSDRFQELGNRLHKAEEQLQTPETRTKCVPRPEIQPTTVQLEFQGHPATPLKMEPRKNGLFKNRGDKALDAVSKTTNSQIKKDRAQKAKTAAKIRDGDNDNKQLPAKYPEPGSGSKSPQTKKGTSQTQSQLLQTPTEYQEDGDWDRDIKVILEKLEEHLEARDNALKRCEKSEKEHNSKLSAAHIKSSEEEENIKELTTCVELMTNERDEAIERIKEIEDGRNKEIEENKKLTEALETEMKKNMKLEAEINFQVKKNLEDKKVMNNQLEALKKEKDDYRDRFSKMAGDRLTDNNADIADLSDPNRAMKLAEKFSSLYDDEWTDAFQDLCKHKIPKKNGLQLLLKILTTCYDLCQLIATQQLDTLSENLAFPVKGKATKEQEDFKGSLQLDPKHVKILREARRQLWEVSIGVITQQLLDQTKDLMDKDLLKAFDDIIPYTEKCAEICWLMVIHEPPVYMKTETPSDDKMDPSTYTAYSASGQKIDFLVWPPLYNGKGGGLLSKGVLELIKTKDKKK